MNEATKIVDALNRIAHSLEQMNIRHARIEASLDILNSHISVIKSRVGR